ncbi:MAG: hypothetical protein J6S51_04565 [Kiritimatiellae bacterium]|nr:hypothetical protein [Kiritimatiellia bacterium]
MKFTALDFETTGYKDGCTNEPWQLGLVVVEDGVITHEKEWFFKTRLTPEANEFMQEWCSFYPYLDSTRLVAHNISTERTILTRAAPLTKFGPWVDTLKLCKAIYPKLEGYSLSEVCTTFGLVPDMPGRTWHDALYDAVACAKLAIFLSAWN